MSDYSNTGESAVANLLTGTVIAASAFMLYASLALPQSRPAPQAANVAAPAIEQVVVTAPRHVS